VWNGSVRWEDEEGRYDVRFYANNLTEEEYFQKLIHSSLSDSRQGSVGAPRQIGLEVGYNF
jgi:outer membrane receptor protein involved in Fe transport